MRSQGLQVFVYPEELRFTPPEALAAQVAALGCTAVSMAVVYHRGRRVLPRHGHVSFLPATTAYFEPAYERYGDLAPARLAAPDVCDAVVRFREACRATGIGFRAWIVALHDEVLAERHPDVAAHGLGGPLGHSLCPSSPDVVAYVATLARDVAAQLRPDAVDVEAWLYPAWEPSYTLTLALEPLEERAVLLAPQCFCRSCRVLLGPREAELEAAVREAAGPPFGAGRWDDALADELAGRRKGPAARLTQDLEEAVRREGAELRLFASGVPAQARLQGLSILAAGHADSVLIGCARLVGAELVERFCGLRTLTGDRPAVVSMNWAPERTPASMADDARALVAAGADGLALYNLSLVPEAGLDAFRAAAAAFREAAGF